MGFFKDYEASLKNYSTAKSICYYFRSGFPASISIRSEGFCACRCVAAVKVMTTSSIGAAGFRLSSKASTGRKRVRNKNAKGALSTYWGIILYNN